MSAITILAQELAGLMAADSLCAVFDVRERGEFNHCQIANATSLPRSQIEFRIAELVPNFQVPIVVYDDNGERAAFAAATLSAIGYAEVRRLEGGLPAWQRAGYPTAGGVNVPSKAFGERVHREIHIPDIEAAELKTLQENSADLIILDVRTPEEYRRFCIPGAVNVPGGDLVLWADALKRDPRRTVIVNCAGRTRSIVGAAALQRLGLTNVKALRNGTMGWVLSGYELERKPPRSAPEAPKESRDRARALALRIAAEEEIAWISADGLRADLAAKPAGVTYLVDVRSESEYDAGHLPHSLSVPGGQAVQRADDFIAVRNGRIVFISSAGARAVMAAYWYRQMGFGDVRVLQDGIESWRRQGGALSLGAEPKTPFGLAAAENIARRITPGAAHARLEDARAAVLDVGSSADFEAGHLPGAKWISRGWLELKLPKSFPDRTAATLLSSPDGEQAMLAARALAELGYKNVMVLDGGTRAWIAAGFPIEKGLAGCLTEPNDVVLSPSIKGSKEEMRRYLEWELKLSR